MNITKTELKAFCENCFYMGKAGGTKELLNELIELHIKLLEE